MAVTGIHKLDIYSVAGSGRQVFQTYSTTWGQPETVELTQLTHTGGMFCTLYTVSGTQYG